MPPRVRALALASLLVVCSAGAAHAATFTVTTGNDRADTAAGDGLCVAQGLTAACTLRAAVQEANALPGPDTIVLPATTYGLANTGSDEDAAATGDLDITTPVTISGSGAAVTEIQQATQDRLFDVQPGGSLTLTDVHLDFGFLTDVVSSGGGDGAGIRSQGALIVRRAWFSDMHATMDVTRNGGGVAIDGGTGTVTDSLFTDLQVENGAGQAAAVTAGSLTLQNVTATGNTDIATGGVFAALGSGALTVRGATILGNAAAAVDRTGGGTAALSFTLAGGAGGACSTDSAPAVTLGPGNVFDQGTPCRDGTDATPRLYGAGGPRVSPLQPAGGVLPSVLVPLTGSPAIDTGAACGALPTDARGGPRPQGASCDAGAVEAGSLSDISVTGAGPGAVDATDAVSDTFAVLNAGSDPSRAVRVTVAATGPGTLFGLTSTRGTCSLATRACTLGDLAPGQQALIRIELRAGLRGTVRATLAATHATVERVTTNDRATITTTVKPDTTMPRMRLAATTVHVRTRRTATFRLTCPATERTCAGTVRPTFRGKHLRTVKVRLVGGRAVAVNVALSASLRRTLRRGSKLTATFAVDVVDASGNRYRASLRGTIRT